jgi:hypothetical protein
MKKVLVNTSNEMRDLYDRIEGCLRVNINDYLLQRAFLPAGSWQRIDGRSDKLGDDSIEKNAHSPVYIEALVGHNIVEHFDNFLVT